MTHPRTPVRSPHALGEAVARLRVERDLTQDELADALGVTRRYIYEIESGRPNLFATRLFEALRELGVHMELVPNERDGNRDG
ncbi:MAG: helix-turn-helix domain-containing protein [Nocardioides sp.]|nr:helix-turn-helix domain-containing protein [Nocardioides sp.]